MAEIRETSQTTERRQGREYALQILYQFDVAALPIEECIDQFWSSRQVRRGIAEFASALARGAAGERDRIDGVLTGISHHWRISRMAVVDRNVLRLALYEMLFEPSTPPVVVINEAIEIAKKFGDDDSGPFINGILDAVRLRLERSEIDLRKENPGEGKPPLRTPA